MTWETFVIILLFIGLILSLVRTYLAEIKRENLHKKLREYFEQLHQAVKEKDKLELECISLQEEVDKLSKQQKKDNELLIYRKEQIKLLQEKIEEIKAQYQTQIKFDKINSRLSEVMYKNLDAPLEEWIENIVSVLAEDLPIGQFSLYLKEEKILRFLYGYGIQQGKDYPLGEGFVGQVALTGFPIFEKTQDYRLFIGDVEVRVAFLIVFPLVFNEEILGVVEYYLLALPEEEDLKRQQELWQKISEGLAAYLRNQDIANLLQQTQQQNALLKQHEEELKKHIQALQEAQNSLREMNETLEQRVKERTKELEQTLEELKTTQQQLLHAEREAVLGKLVSNIAHEVNTPFGAIKASAEDIETALPVLNNQYAELITSLAPRDQKLLQKFLTSLLSAPIQQASAKEERKLKRTYKRILEADNNPLAYPIAQKLILAGFYGNISPYTKLFKHPRVEEITDIIYAFGRLKTDSTTIKISIEKVKKIIYALKFYTQKASGDKVKIDLKQSIKQVLQTYQNYLKNINVRIYFPENPVVIQGIRDEIDLIWQNIIFNSIQALAKQPKKEISVKLEDYGKFVRIKLADNGPGIPPEIQKQLFEPFVTTKTGGEGTGLGLNIVHKIVTRHNGKIRFKSVEGRTEFTIDLPKNP